MVAKKYLYYALAAGVILGGLILAIFVFWSPFLLMILTFVVVGSAFYLVTVEHTNNKIDEKDMLLDIMFEYSSENVIFITDQDGRILRSNEAAGEVAPNLKIGQKIDDVIRFTDESQSRAPLFPDSATIVTSTMLDRILVMSNKTRMATMKIIPFFISPVSGRLERFMIIVYDTTHNRTLEDERNEFISIASHEFRTPLAIAKDWISTVISSGDNPEIRQKGLVSAEQALDQLSSIITKLITLSNAQKGVLSIEIKPVDMAQTVKSLVDEISLKAQAKKLTLALNISPKLNPVITSSYRVSEILRIYLENAVKFTNAGQVRIDVYPSESGGVTVLVKDTGVGIPAAAQSKLFTKFYQVEDVLSRSNEGLGLGLFIAKKLALRLNADVWCESKEGLGSSFFLHVPQFSRYKEDTQRIVDVSLQDVANAL